MADGTEGTCDVEVPVGETFVIALPSVPATGYTWEVAYDTNRLELVRANDLKGLGPGVGAGGEEEFEFRARAPGPAVVQLQYRRLWEEQTKETRSYRVQVRS
jgi:predicted secreted protein